MATPRKHAALIKAWADGAEIQHAGPADKWIDNPNPAWDINAVYRIKPEALRYRVALMRRGNGPRYTTTADQMLNEKEIESFSDFVRWLTDWI